MTFLSRSRQLVAHRGGAQLAPENTLAAFRNALTMAADTIELDVQMSHDGQMIVFHDETVDRVTDGTGNILDLDFAELRSLNAAARFPGGWPLPEQIPTLPEVLHLAKNRVKVYIEIKLSERNGKLGRYPMIAETVLKELRAARMVRDVTIISFDWVTLARMRHLEPDLVTGALVASELWNPEDDPQLTKLCQQVTAAGCNWINMDYQLCTPEIVEIVHQNGFKLGLWTVDDLNALRFWSSAKVDSLTSDRPDLFAQL
jgi:Glycerophosphoryl diester phosphodiesterase